MSLEQQLTESGIIPEHLDSLLQDRAIKAVTVANNAGISAQIKLLKRMGQSDVAIWKELCAKCLTEGMMVGLCEPTEASSYLVPFSGHIDSLNGYTATIIDMEGDAYIVDFSEIEWFH